VLSFPAIAGDDDPLGRVRGEALCPERFDESAIAGIRKALGAYWFSALYQQSPRPEDGSVFKESWFPRYSGEPPGELLRRTQVLDSAHKTRKENDYSCITTLDMRDAGTYLRHVWREKVTYPDLKHRTQELFAEWCADEICIEDKDAGAMLIQELQRDTQLPVIPIKTDRDKVARAHAATPLCEAGRVFLPNSGEAPWLGEFLSELLAFPNAEHDDQVDAFVHGLNRLKDIGPVSWKAEDLIVDTGHRFIDWDSEFAL
jgi:predicted phage terminase large subunit-like protein